MYHTSNNTNFLTKCPTRISNTGLTGEKSKCVITRVQVPDQKVKILVVMLFIIASAILQLFETPTGLLISTN